MPLVLERATRRARDLLTQRRLPWLAALLATALGLPFLLLGFQVDDYFQRAVFLDPPDLQGLFGAPVTDMFAFADGDPERMSRLVDLGIFPWFTRGDLRLHFWRPLAVATHALDYRLWPARAWLMHLHSLLWLGAGVYLAARLYRRVMGLSVAAGLAALVFALDDAHSLPAGWLANRSALLALVWGLLTILLHDEWRRDGRRGAAVLAPLCLLLALLSKESAVAVCGYLFSYALFLDRGDLRSRVLSLVPYGLVAVVWRLYYRAAGYGVSDSGSYLDPLLAPVQFLKALLARGPVLLLGQLALPPSDFFTFSPPAAHWVFVVVAVLVLFLLAVAFAPLVRSDGEARFWLLGMLLSLVPACTASPQDRLLVFSGLGAAALVALFLVSVRRVDRRAVPEGPSASSSLRRWVYRGLVSVHLVVAPLLFVGMMLLFDFGSDLLVDLGRQTVPAEAEDRTVVLANMGNYPVGSYLVLDRALRPDVAPVRVRSLAPGTMVAVPMEIHRVDEYTLLVKPEGGYSQSLFRDRASYAASDRVALSGMTVEIAEVTNDGWPSAVTFRFEVPLEHPSLVWWQISGARGQAWVPPSVGETVSLMP
jgi:hypothetical protein